ncbi:MAG: hypothetical protein H6605_08655 [Flavobacteriales bacterium]|nr:hypothetical protein [Flavobacteriales bacterium]
MIKSGIRSLLIFVMLTFMTTGKILAQNKGDKINIPEYDEDYVDPFLLIDSMVYQYIRWSDLKGKNDSFSIEKKNNFRKLFMENAKVVDEICPGYYYNDFTNPYQLQIKPISAILDKIQENFPGGLTVRYLRADTSMRDINKNIVYIEMEKILEGTTKKGLRIEVHDTMEIEVIYINNLNEVRINSTKMLGGVLMLDNDYDKDFVPDNSDKCVNVKALGKPDGCPDQEVVEVKKKPGFFLQFNAFTGRMQANVDYTDNANKVYDLSGSFMDNKNGTPNIGSMLNSGFEVGFEYFFGKRRHLGLGSGFQYSKMKGVIEKKGFEIKYRNTDRWGREYKSIVSVTDGEAIRENFEITQLSFPVYLKFQGLFTKHLGFQMDAGVNLVVNLNGSSAMDGNAKFDYEAVYYTIDAGKNYSFNAQNDPDNSWMITREQATIFSKGNEEIYFNQLYDEGFDVGLNKNIDQSTSVKNFNYSYQVSSGYILKPSCQYWFSDQTSINLGIILINSDYVNKQDTDRYKLTGRVGDYNTMFNGIDRFNTTAIIINFGFKHAFNR